VPFELLPAVESLPPHPMLGTPTTHTSAAAQMGAASSRWCPTVGFTGSAAKSDAKLDIGRTLPQLNPNCHVEQSVPHAPGGISFQSVKPWLPCQPRTLYCHYVGAMCSSPRPTVTAGPPTVTCDNVVPFVVARAYMTEARPMRSPWWIATNVPGLKQP